MSKAANKAISLLQPGNRASDVAATFTSHATGWRGQHVFEISAMDFDDKCKTCGKTRRRLRTTKALTLTEWKDPDNIDFDNVETTTCRETVNSEVAP